MLKAMKESSVRYWTVEFAEDWTIDSHTLEDGVKKD
jgi:hypothetical protein